MRNRISILVLGTLLIYGMPEPGFAESQSFKANVEIADKNYQEPGGAEYNLRLYRYFGKSPESSSAIETCMKSNLSKEPVTGYLEFHKEGGYTVVLRPVGALGTCVIGAFSGRDPPEPPSRPYITPFTVNSGE